MNRYKLIIKDRKGKPINKQYVEADHRNDVEDIASIYLSPGYTAEIIQIADNIDANVYQANIYRYYAEECVFDRPICVQAYNMKEAVNRIYDEIGKLGYTDNTYYIRDITRK